MTETIIPGIPIGINVMVPIKDLSCKQLVSHVNDMYSDQKNNANQNILIIKFMIPPLNMYNAKNSNAGIINKLYRKPYM